MRVTPEEIMEWLLKDHKRTIVAYAEAHDLEPQEVIDMLQAKNEGEEDESVQQGI